MSSRRTAVLRWVLYCGAVGAGKRASLQQVQLASRHLNATPVEDISPADSEAFPCFDIPGVGFGVRVAASSGLKYSHPTRRQLESVCNAVIYVADLRPERFEASVLDFEQTLLGLQEARRDPLKLTWGVQYNHFDAEPATSIEDMQLALGELAPELAPIDQAATVAHRGRGVVEVFENVIGTLGIKL